MDLYRLPVRTIDGAATTLEQYRGQALLIVNVASRCGFTPQYRALQALYVKYKAKGFVVLGFPCNQFGGQEPGDEAAIQGFCSGHYGVTFPLFAKVDVNGPHAHPLYRHLTSAKPGLLGRRSVSWNFTKFLIGRDGTVLRRYAPRRAPDTIAKDVEAALV